MTEIMLSIRPKWCKLIASGQKTIEVRKTKPKCNVPFKVYIYCTKQRVNGEILLTYDKKIEGRNRGFRDVDDIPLAGKVIGEFVCDRIYELVTYSQGGSYYVKGEDQSITNDVARHSCLTLKDMHEYLRSNVGYGWHISDLIIYDEPKDLSDYKKLNRQCYYADLGYAKPTCSTCCDSGCMLSNPPQSFCYVEKERESNDE